MCVGARGGPLDGPGRRRARCAAAADPRCSRDSSTLRRYYGTLAHLTGVVAADAAAAAAATDRGEKNRSIVSHLMRKFLLCIGGRERGIA